MKFGGSSVATPELIKKVALIIKKQRSEIPNLVVVVSAMGKSTDQLLKLASEVSPQSSRYRREIDMLLTTGERISMALLSMALEDLDLPSISFTGSQSGIITSSEHGEARILEIRPQRIREALASKKIVIVAGFQGVSREKEVTTLGRGGSDTSAVALGVALDADQVDIYTDVDGFYSADPRKIPGAHRQEKLGLREAYLSAARGARVLHSRCLEIAFRHKTRIRVLSTFNPENGGSTIVENTETAIEGPKIVQITRQDSLILLKLNSETLSADRASFRSDYLDRKSSGDRTEILLSASQWTRWKERLSKELLKAAEAAKILASRLSLIGSGLDSADEVLARIDSLFEQHGVRRISEHRSDFLIESVVVESPGLDALLQALHQEFIEKN